jgi:hypothetical protein
VTKPRIPLAIKQRYEEIEGLKVQEKMQIQAQKTHEQVQITESRTKYTQAEK